MGRSSSPPSGVFAESIASSLLLRLREKNQEAWKQLDFLFGPVIAQWLARAGVPAADAADLQQDILRRVAENIGKFQREKKGDTFRGWLWTITLNKVRDHARRLKRVPRAEGGSDAAVRIAAVSAPDEDSLAAPDADHAELRGLLERAIQLVKEEIKPHTWESFWLTTVEGLTAAEAAERLGVAVGSVYTAKSRVLSRLREVLGDDCEKLLTWS